LHGKTIKNMEKEKDLTLLKARSYRSVLNTGFRLYMEQFRSFFKKSWLTALVLAILYGTFGALMLLMKPDSIAALLTLVLMPLVLPIIYALVRRVLKLHRDYWLAPRYSWKMRLRNTGLMLIVLFTSALLVMLVSCIVLIPAVILCLANLKALQGMLIGDPSGMPSYMTGLTFFTFVLTAFVQFYVSQLLLVHYYYVCGSAQAREEKRKSLQNLIQ